MRMRSGRSAKAGRRPVRRCGDVAGQDVGGADEAGDEGGGRALVDLLGRADLLDAALVEHGDAVAHAERLVLVVGDEDEGDADLALDRLQLDLHLLAQLEVERAQRLVQQQHARARLTSARASATRWRWPPESCDGPPRAEAGQRHQRQHLFARCAGARAFGTPRIIRP